MAYKLSHFLMSIIKKLECCYLSHTVGVFLWPMELNAEILATLSFRMPGNTSEYLFCSFLYHFFKNQPPLRHLSRVEFFISLSFLHFFFHAIVCNLMYMYITFIYLYRLFFLDHNEFFYDIFSFLVQPINKTHNCL